MNLQDKEMLNELIVESREHLSEIEPDLLELEQKGDAISGELINRIFRAVHSIKGGFGFFGVDHIMKLSHAMENIMAKVRDKKLLISPEVTEALLKGVTSCGPCLTTFPTRTPFRSSPNFPSWPRFSMKPRDRRR
jgi:two-component system, chemotaxis family, sensor kinase CheA